MMMFMATALLIVVITVIVLHLAVFLYLRRLAWLKRSNICVKAPLLPVALVTGEIAKYFNRRPESEVSSYEAYNSLWFKDFALDRHHVWLRVASSAAIDDIIPLSLKAIQRWSTQRGKIAIHSSMRRLHFGITIEHAIGEVSPQMEEELYGALNAFDPGHLYRSLSIRHPFRSANILSKKYTQQAYLQLQSLLRKYLKSSVNAPRPASRPSMSRPSMSSGRKSMSGGRPSFSGVRKSLRGPSLLAAPPSVGGVRKSLLGANLSVPRTTSRASMSRPSVSAASLAPPPPPPSTLAGRLSARLSASLASLFSGPPKFRRSQVLTSLLEYHGDLEKSTQVAEDKAIADIIAYLLGAISNVSSVLAWMIYDFSHHPEWRLRALKEAQKLFPGGVQQLEDRDQLRKAKVLRQCINESIRLRDRFTTGIRRLTQDVTVPLPNKSSSAGDSSVVSSSSVPHAPDSPSSSPPEACSTMSSTTTTSSTNTMTFQKGSYVILPYYYDGIDDPSYNPDRQLPRSHFPMFGSGTHTCRGRDYAVAQITAMISFLLLTDSSNTTGDASSSSSGSLSLSSSKSSSSLPFRWIGHGKWVSSVPWSMASTTGVNSPPDDAPVYVEM